MKVLLTSGGTRTAVDDVRILTNLSTGTFGNHLCRALMEAGHEVHFLYAKGSKCLHELRSDLSCFLSNEVTRENFYSKVLRRETTENRAEFLWHNKDKYLPIAYADFHDYATKLRDLLKQNWDIVILAAAVSDYEPVAKADGKISSEKDSLTIELKQTPKLIREVKQLCPDTFLVGFKLLVGSTQEQLENAMVSQMEKASTDMVVGNDLRDIRAAQHRLTTLSIDQHFYQFELMPGDQLAEELAKDIIRDARTMNGDFAHLGAPGRKQKAT